MLQSKHKNNWPELYAAFEEVGTTQPRKRKKSEDSIETKCFVLGPSIKKLAQSSDIQNLSKLIAACEPKLSSDLSVSKQKQKEIKDWFGSERGTGKPRVLILSGPSGCGKTMALKIIAKENDYDVKEWLAPFDFEYSEEKKYDWTRMSDVFLDFLIRTTRYNSVIRANSRRLLLVKDIPNIYFVKEHLFSGLLEKYFEYGKGPLVFIFTDGGNTNTLNSLFPASVKERFLIDHININSTTQNAMKNMLKRVSGILNLRASRIIDVRQRHIDEVLYDNVGDARSSILNLIFHSLKVSSEKLSHDYGTREETLGLFHAIGRVINPKRNKIGDSWKFVHDPDEIVSTFQSQSKTFLHFLHENYMNTMGEIEEVEKCANVMSLSDMLTQEWRDPNLTKLNLSFCVRGVMINNKNPVSGWNPVKKPRSAETKITKSLAEAEENCYKSIINSRNERKISSLDDTLDFSNLDETLIEENSE